MKKYFTIATIAAAALAVTACQKAEQDVPVDETAATQIELNEDGSVATSTNEASEAQAEAAK